MTEPKETEEEKTEMNDTGKIEKTDATADEIALAIFAAADSSLNDSNSQTSDDENELGPKNWTTS